jgi:hypothetical protein
MKVRVEADEGEGCAVVCGVEMTEELLVVGGVVGVIGVVEVVEGVDEDVRVDDEVEGDGWAWEVGETGVLADVAEAVTATGESTMAVVGWTVPGSVEESRPKRRLSSFGRPCRRLCLKGPCGMISRRNEGKKKGMWG